MTADAKEVWSWIIAQRKPEFTNGELTYAFRQRKSGKAARLRKAFEVLIDSNLISGAIRVPGKKTLLYQVHPNMADGGL